MHVCVCVPKHSTRMYACRLVTDEDYLRERLPFMDLSRLKVNKCT